MENENKLPAENTGSKEYHEELKGSDADYAATGQDDQQSDPAEELKGSDADFADAGALDDHSASNDTPAEIDSAEEKSSAD